eukprot:TRINITY_DN6185_c0_g5_i1.p1 TRINITY_DN6185_c0_g5~~TRINITY_DN6185_c0_g5_i1.p1  ORF type:complete len:140 (+),score=21.02 TRINITY_DN6185_c0_g5_i1:202-621(+)
MVSNPAMTDTYSHLLLKLQQTEQHLRDKDSLHSNLLSLIHILDAAENELSTRGSRYLTGSVMTVADCCLAAVLHATEQAAMARKLIQPRIHLLHYLKRFKARETYRKISGSKAQRLLSWAYSSIPSMLSLYMKHLHSHY